ncbi:MAG: UDP-N-acetylmuramoyl-L-alanine--D-glutamate ligase [Alphaproteobacteria bacterium]|nr:UDP-N-acetylmuramoyl-L-alanine--D-glutamate ligase [Alphaproteobacteria bacterium]
MPQIKDFVETLSGRPVLVYGLGRSGLSCVKALKKAGAEIVAGDDNPESYDSLPKGVVILEESSHDIAEYAFVVLSPGIPFTHPEPHEIVEKAHDAGVEVICDIELYARIYKDIKTIGITGTNGKSTTAALVHHIVEKQGISCALAGNIGTPIFDIKPKGKDFWLVLEMSSFQIDLCPTFRPTIGALLNVSPDHIDRHGTFENYMEVKERILEAEKAVICVDDVHTQKIYEARKADHVHSVTASVFDRAFDDLEYLKGEHNHQNVAVACAIARLAGIDLEKMWPDIVEFRGLPHRQYLVRTINGVSYVNDSKATNAASTAVALASRNNIYWIVGGRKKKNGLEGLEEFFGNIKHAFLIGEATDDFAEWFENYTVEYSKSYDLESALRAAHKMAQDHRGQPGGAGVVLLSPACASFDQFKSFEDRGEVFCDLVDALEEF